AVDPPLEILRDKRKIGPPSAPRRLQDRATAARDDGGADVLGGGDVLGVKDVDREPIEVRQPRRVVVPVDAARRELVVHDRPPVVAREERGPVSAKTSFGTTQRRVDVRALVLVAKPERVPELVK